MVSSLPTKERNDSQVNTTWNGDTQQIQNTHALAKPLYEKPLGDE